MPAQRLLRGMTLGSYRTIRLIARGGMGEVYEAVDQILERPVAIKIMSTDSDQGIDATSFLSMFTLEARVLAKIDHQNVVRVYDVGTFDGAPYIAMEFVDGVPLSHLTAKEVLTVEQMFSVFIPLFEALACLHDGEVVHRDIKPSNILIRRDGAVKLVDFGIAIRQGWEGTTSSAEMGTADYTAPEVYRGTNVSPSSDLWSAGAVLFESLVEVKLAHKRRDHYANIEFPQELHSRLPAELRRIIVKLCMADPHQRYQTGCEVVTDLTKLYRAIYPTKPVLSQTFRGNLREVLERVDKLSESAQVLEDKTMVMPPELPPEVRAQGQIKPKREEPRRPKRSFFAGALRVARALMLWGGVVYIGYDMNHLDPITDFSAKPQVNRTVASVKVANIELVSPYREQKFVSDGHGLKLDLKWKCLPGVGQYHAQVSRDHTFGEIDFDRRVDHCEWKNISIHKGRFAWRVRPENQPDGWSQPNSFIVD